MQVQYVRTRYRPFAVSGAEEINLSKVKSCAGIGIGIC